jgi:transcriptional regulator of acetoin/glycerol metabolism
LLCYEKRGLPPIPYPEREMMSLEENERRHILWVLEQTGGRIGGVNGATKHLDIPYSTLYSRMKKLGIRVHRNPTRKTRS